MWNLGLICGFVGILVRFADSSSNCGYLVRIGCVTVCKRVVWIVGVWVVVCYTVSGG